MAGWGSRGRPRRRKIAELSRRRKRIGRKSVSMVWRENRISGKGRKRNIPHSSVGFVPLRVQRRNPMVRATPGRRGGESHAVRARVVIAKRRGGKERLRVGLGAEVAGRIRRRSREMPPKQSEAKASVRRSAP
jgi:hypothetical protein